MVSAYPINYYNLHASNSNPSICGSTRALLIVCDNLCVYL